MNAAAVRCPVCSGPIGVHVVRRVFTCHHCRWALSANNGTAFIWSLWVVVLAVLASVGVAVLLPFPTSNAISAGFELGLLVGVAWGVPHTELR